MHHGNPYYGVMFEALRELHKEMTRGKLTSHDELVPEDAVSLQPKSLGLLRRVAASLWQRKPGFEGRAPVADDACPPLVCQPVISQE